MRGRAGLGVLDGLDSLAQGFSHPLLADSVGGAEFLGEEADAQFLNHPADLLQLGTRHRAPGQELHGLIVGVLKFLHGQHELVIPVDVGPQLLNTLGDRLEVAGQMVQLNRTGFGHKPRVDQVLQLALHVAHGVNDRKRGGLLNELLNLSRFLQNIGNQLGHHEDRVNELSPHAIEQGSVLRPGKRWGGGHQLVDSGYRAVTNEGVD